MNHKEMFMWIGITTTVMVFIKLILIIISWVNSIKLRLYNINSTTDILISRVTQVEDEISTYRGLMVRVTRLEIKESTDGK